MCGGPSEVPSSGYTTRSAPGGAPQRIIMTAIITETALAEHTVRVIFFTGTPSFASALCDTMFPGAVLKLLGGCRKLWVILQGFFRTVKRLKNKRKFEKYKGWREFSWTRESCSISGRRSTLWTNRSPGSSPRGRRPPGRSAGPRAALPCTIPSGKTRSSGGCFSRAPAWTRRR